VVAGYRWQSVLGHRLELGDPPSGGVGAPGTWGLSRWDEGLWVAGWAPTFHDVTPDCLHIHSATGALGLDIASGIGSLEVELLDLEGRYSPEGGTDWLLGRHIRGWVTPEGAPETPFFYGIIDQARGGGTFAVPLVTIGAVDVRSIIAAAVSIDPVGNVSETAIARLRKICAAAGIPASATVLENDPTLLLPDATLELGDLFDRTVESAAGLAYADAYGRVVTRHRSWITATAPAVSLYVYAGEPVTPPPAGVRVAQTTGDLDATQSLATVANRVTYANRNEPPDSVTVENLESQGRYGLRRRSTTDLASPADLLPTLAARDLELRAEPIEICESATVTVYDADTARAAALGLGELVVLGRNDPGVAQWEIPGVVAGLELTIDPDRCDIGVTVVRAGRVIGAPAVWDTAKWDSGTWQTVTVPVHTTVWKLGPSATAKLDSGNIMGPAPALDLEASSSDYNAVTTTGEN
jgi:hypothetical protein